MNEKILSMLKSSDDFVSGEHISGAVGITRAGLWKKIDALRKKGYVIEAVPSQGYRLVASPDKPTSEEIKTVFRGEIIGREIIFYDVTSSTNDRAMDLGHKNYPTINRSSQQRQGKRRGVLEGTVVVADAQESGRGRFGRQWISPPGVNLYFTVLFEPDIPTKNASLFTLMAAVAVASAIHEHIGLDAQIKWPNDILIKNKKVGGILSEMKSDIDRINFLALGIGVNVNMSRRMLPEQLRSYATSLKVEKGEIVSRVNLLAEMLSQLEYWYKALIRGRKDTLLDAWLKLDSTVGKSVRVQTSEGIIAGIAEGISSDGELIIKQMSGAHTKVYAGEVTILKN